METKSDGGQVIIIGQRLNIVDPMALIGEALEFHSVVIPAIAPEDHTYDCGHGQTYVFRAGEVLQEALISREELEKRRRAMGNADFCAQYLQDPLPDGGGALNFASFKRFDTPPKNLMIFHSWDVARTPGGGDYTVGIKFGYAEEKYYVLDVYRAQYDVTQVFQFVRQKVRSDRPAWTIIETADGSGDAVYRMLRQDGLTRIERFSPRKSKEDRFYEIVPMIEAGDVYLPSTAPRLQEFRNEYMSFPSQGKRHDDQLDALSQFLRYSNKLVGKAEGTPPMKYFNDTVFFRISSFGSSFGSEPFLL